MSSAWGADQTKHGSRCSNLDSSMGYPDQIDDDDVSRAMVSLLVDSHCRFSQQGQATTPRIFSREASAEWVAENLSEKSYLGKDLNISPVKSAMTILSDC